MTTRASYPSQGYSRPSPISPSGLTVTVYGESGDLFGEKNFHGIKAPPQLVKELVRGFAVATGSDGRWRSKATVQEAASLLRRFAADIAGDNPQITAMHEFSAEMWWQWRTKVTERTRWPGQVNLARCLLREVESLQDTTRRALSARTKKPKSRRYQAYSVAEYRRIYAAAWRIVRQAKRRIAKNLGVLQQYRQGNEPSDAPALPIRRESWTYGRLLDHMMKTGHFPENHVPHHRMAEFRELLGVTEPGTITQAVFATTTEVFSAIILLVCERGFNLSVMNGLTAEPLRADARDNGHAITVHPLDKPRRGPGARFFSASLTGKAGRIWSSVHEITQPAREFLSATGQPTDALLLGRVLEGQSVDGLFKSDWSHSQSSVRSWQERAGLLADDESTLAIDFRRLRLTEQVINQQSNQNSEQVSESVYRRPDPQTQGMARETILQGQLDAIADAEAVVAVRAITTADLERAKNDPNTLSDQLGISVARVKQLLEGTYDTATAACVDMLDSPFSEKGSACRASFLKCFSCRNAIVTPLHLPRLVILHDALTDIASAVAEAIWRSDYLKVHSQLSALLDDFATTAELDAARKNAKPEDSEAITALLERRLDA